MTRDDLEHLIRAAAAILASDEIVVIGSQAIHGSFDERALPAAATESIEADLMPADGDPVKADLIEGSLGKLSFFVDPSVVAERIRATSGVHEDIRKRALDLVGETD